MIGTTLKLGFDGTSVARGLGNVSKLLGKFGHQFGIGVARQVGARVTDLMGRIVTAIPEALKETADWAGNMNDMATQTGIGIDKLVLMEEALRLSGAEAADTSRIMAVLADNINTAASKGGPAAEALEKLGLSAQELKGMGIDQVFYKIGKRVAELNKTTQTTIGFNDPFSKDFGRQKVIETTDKLEGMETIMADIFGAKMDYKMIRFFKDFDGSMAQANNNVGVFGKQMADGQAAAMDQWGDALGRWETVKRSLSSIVLDEMFRTTGGAGGVDRLFNFLDPEKIRPQIQALTSMLGRNLEVLLSQDLTSSLGDLMKNLGKSFGEGIRDSLKIDVKSFLPGIFGAGSGGKSPANRDQAANLLMETNSLLTDIRKTVGISRFA